MQTAQSRRTYDHRIKQAILESENRDLFPELEIPQSRASALGGLLHVDVTIIRLLDGRRAYCFPSAGSGLQPLLN
jgi:hypothetical protein